MSTPTVPRHEEDRDWLDGALCAQTDPEIFFPEPGGSITAAKKVCAACDVREQCLAYAQQRNIRVGVFGGLSERERLTLKRQSRNAA